MPKQDVAVELFYDGAWHNLVTDDLVLAGAPIVIQRGDSAESSAPRPSSVSLRLDNTDDRFRTSNPLSPLYGKAGVNTPLRISVGDSVRSYTGASSWKADQSPDFRRSPKRGSAWVDVQGGGLLQRIGNWSRSVTSPLRVATEGLSGLVGYWPLEDPAGALFASSPTLGARNVKMVGHSFGSQNRPPGGAPAVDVGERPFATFLFDTSTADPASTAGWQVNQVIYLDGLPTGGLAVPLIAMGTVSLDNFFVDIDGDTNELTLISPAPDHTVDTGDYRWQGRWIMMHMEATYSGGTTTIGVYWRAVDDPDWEFFTVDYTGTPSVPYYSATAPPSGCTYGHYVACAGFAADLRSSDRFDAFIGHVGERASYRFGRLCDESNVPYYVSAGFDASQHMGAQGPDTLAGQFKEIAATEDSLIFDYRTELRVYMLSRADRYNQAPALTLNADDDPSGMPSLPAETTDELPIHNLVTAKQRDGGEYTAEDATSPMGTQDPPDGRGEYRQDIDVNVYDPAHDLRQQAYWWLNRGTVDLPRFPKVTVNMAVLDADKLAEVEAVDVGSVIEIVNYRENTIRLYVLGYRETIGTHSRMIEFTCFPDQQFQVGVYGGDDDYTPRYDLVTCTLDGDHTATDTTLALAITGDEAWSTTGEPYDLMISGELVTVTSMGARTGTGPYAQTATVTRSGNGVIKALPDGAPVHIATPGRWAL